MYQLLDLFKSPDPIVLNFKMQLKCSFIVKKGSSFRSQACCHWGVNFQFKHIEHIESKSNFLYEPHHNFTGQCRLSDAIHLPLFITFTFSSCSSAGLTRSHHVSAPADLLFPISTFLGKFYTIIFTVLTNTL